MRIAHRVAQFLRATLAGRRPDLSSVSQVRLNPREEQLFLRQSPADQRHAIAVFERLRANGNEDPELLQAALLHDVGKTDGRIRLWHRVVYVLLGWATPSLLKTLSGSADRWAKPFSVLRGHEERGAELAGEAGADSRVVSLIAHHHKPLRSAKMDERALELLAALREADEGTG